MLVYDFYIYSLCAENVQISKFGIYFMQQRGEPTHILHHIGKLHWNQTENVSIFPFLSLCLLSPTTH